MSAVDRPGPPEPALLQALWVAIERQGDLPGLAHAIRAIVAAMHDDEANSVDMSNAVLADASLTNRVLRLANSAMYRVFGEVGTVSRAIMILGTRAIGNLAMSSKVFEQLEATGRVSVAARAECVRASLAGAIARELAHPKGGAALAEKAAVCASLFGLGSVLLAYYLPARWNEIRTLAEQDAVKPDHACRSLHGVSLVDVSRAFARRWGLPSELTSPLRDVGPRDPHAPMDHDEWIAALSLAALAAARARLDGVADAGALARSDRHAAMLGIEPEELAAATRTAGDGVHLAHVAPGAPVATARPADGVERLRQGLDELQHAAHAAASLQTLACLAMEVVHRALGLRRCAVFLRQPSAGRWVACSAVGELSLRLRGPTPASFPDAYQPDLFHDALATREPAIVQTPDDPRVPARVPTWWSPGASAPPSSLVFVPSFLEAHPIALIAGDWGRQPQAPLTAAEKQGLATIGRLLADALRLQAAAQRQPPAPPGRRR